MASTCILQPKFNLHFFYSTSTYLVFQLEPTMQLHSSLTLTLCSLLPSLSSAWRIQLYREPGYQVKIVDHSDVFSIPCQNIATDLNDQVSSLHWESEGALGLCTIMLYRNRDCAVNIGRSTQDWHNPRFSDANNDQLSSWRVDCPDN